MGVPTFYARLLAEPGLTREACARVRLFVSGSAPLAAETHMHFESRTGQRILRRLRTERVRRLRVGLTRLTHSIIVGYADYGVA